MNRGETEMLRKLSSLFGAAVLVVLTFASDLDAKKPTAAADRSDRLSRAVPAHINELKLDEPIPALEIVRKGKPAKSRVWSELGGVTGIQKVIVRLRTPSVAMSGKRSDLDQQDHKRQLERDQANFVERAKKIAKGTIVLADAQMVLNAVFLELDGEAIAELAKDSDVLSIHRVRDYEMDLSETVPYIGAAFVQADGHDGSGVRVAVLDSGIDYYHAAFGGSGDPADYAADNPNIIEPGTFPTAKVVGGFDFVGGAWPVGPLAPDPDPLDDGPAAGHGSHVSHIIGGTGGVAPGVDLYAVKVCSSVSSSCSGIALINGMEFAADPNGDGKTKDHVDVINMSLGASYGQPFDDDLSQAVNSATALGILTVASAGNSADKPYATGTPSAAATALSVAQTQVPSAGLQFFDVDGVDYPAVFQPWSVPLTSLISAPVQYGDGGGGNLNGCNSFASESLTGRIVLVDRGACNFTLKISNISQAGGLAGIIGLVASGAPFGGGDGGDRPIDIPGYMINQADSTAIKAQIGNPGIGTLDPAAVLPLIMQMVGSSSRGPQNENTSLIKPEIGAPGASVSAIAGTGTGEGPFGGTSGAAPMVTGSAALLLDGFDTNGKGKGQGDANGLELSPLEVKALLMNTGEINIDTDPFTGLAPITRIGGGEVRVDSAIAARAAAWEDGGAAGGLSFGYIDVADGLVQLTKTVAVHNYANERRTVDVIASFRYPGDETGAVTISAPNEFTLNPGFGNEDYFDVTLTINGDLLSGNSMNSGSMGASSAALTDQEYDGYITLVDDNPFHLPWHVLPRKAARVVPSTTSLAGGGFPEVVGLNNTGVGTAQNDAYSLLAVSPNMPEGGAGEQSPIPDIRAVGINTIPVPAGFCSGQDSFLWLFAINTWERQEHLVPVSHQFWLDTDQDGTPDFVVLNRDFSFNNVTDGRQLSWVFNLATGATSAFFFAEHSTNTGNTVLIICGEQVGLTGTDLLATNVDMFVVAEDFYYGGLGDFVGGLTVTPLGEQYFGLANDVAGNTNDPAGLSVFDFGPFPGNSAELGVMMLGNGDRGSGARGGATQDTEALLFTVP
jgi:subtilisin family serine protease